MYKGYDYNDLTRAFADLVFTNSAVKDEEKLLWFRKNVDEWFVVIQVGEYTRIEINLNTYELENLIESLIKGKCVYLPKEEGVSVTHTKHIQRIDFKVSRTTSEEFL